MRSKLLSAAAALATFFISTTAFAGANPSSPIPEPGTWALVGLAAAIGWAVTRSKRK